jgi:hypothetical protein
MKNLRRLYIVGKLANSWITLRQVLININELEAGWSILLVYRLIWSAVLLLDVFLGVLRKLKLLTSVLTIEN